MGARELRLTELIGAVVRNPVGRPFSRLEEVRVEPDGETYVVREYVLGPAGFLEALGMFLRQVPVLRALPFGKKLRQRAIPWAWLDLSDPSHPRTASPCRRGARPSRPTPPARRAGR